MQRGSGLATLKLEGKLAGPWVGELEKIWRSGNAPEAVLVNLIEISFVDASGKELLAQMYQRGADFVTDSPLLKQVIKEVTGSLEGWSTPVRLTQCAHTSKGEKP
jgi:hypothetical protein